MDADRSVERVKWNKETKDLGGALRIDETNAGA
jgi:hypothetical protein